MKIIGLTVGFRAIGAVLYSLAIVNTIAGVRTIIVNDFLFWQNLIISFQVFIEFLIFSQVGVMTFQMSSVLEYEKSNVDTKSVEEYPELDVYITMRRVDPKVLRNTVENLRNQDYPQDKLHVFLGDDTPEQDLVEQYREIAEEFNAVHVYDPTNKLYKAGMMNIALKKGNSSYVAFFDHDQQPLPGILTHFIKVFQAHPDASYVQAKKSFRDLYNLSRVWSALLYVQVFEVLQKTKNKKRTTMFLGSTACFKRLAIEDIGGIPTRGFTEDSDLATALMVSGHYGVFTDVYGSIGTVPTGYSAQLSQLWRWILGGSQGLNSDFKRIWQSKHLTLDQKADITSTLAIGVIVMFVFTYAFSFIPLILTGVDSARFTIFGVSSLILSTIVPLFVYILIIVMAIRSVRKHENSELRYIHIPGFLIIAIASVLLILDSAILGLLGLRRPSSTKATWTKEIKIKSRATTCFIIGVIVAYISIKWLVAGYQSAILLLIIALAYFPALPVALYYNRKSMD